MVFCLLISLKILKESPKERRNCKPSGCRVYLTLNKWLVVVSNALYCVNCFSSSGYYLIYLLLSDGTVNSWYSFQNK